MEVVRFALLYFRKLRSTLILYCLLSIITGWIAIYTPIINEKFINIITGTIQGDYVSYIIQFCVISLINLGIMCFIKVTGVKLQKESSYGIITDSIHHLSGYELFFGNDSVYAYVSQRIKSDADTITAFFIEAATTVPVNVIVGIVSGVILFFYNRTIFIILAFLAVGYCVLYFILRDPLKKSGLESKQASDIYYSKIEMSVSKLKFAKIHGVLNRFHSFLNKSFFSDLETTTRFQKIAFLNFSLETIIGAIAQAAIYITGGALILRHQLSIGGFVVILVYFAYVTNAIKRIFSLNENYQLARAAYDRLHEYLDIPLYDDGDLTTTEIDLVEFKDVRFSFDGKFEISNVNMTFKRGTLYGLCGKNGSGKTTLMLLLLGMYSSYQGEILINGINRNKYNMQSIRSEDVQYIEQSPVFFDETMKDNFDLFEGERRPSLQVEQYIHMLNLQNIICFKNGEFTFIGHQQYSAGELAKISILRSLILKKSVYILDEPDTSLDESAKQALIQILRDISSESIVIIITHDSDLLTACKTVYSL